MMNAKKRMTSQTPTLKVVFKLRSKKENDSIKSYEDLEGKTVGAKVGTESADFLIENEDKYGYTIKYYDAADQLYAAVSGGQIDAMMDDYPVIGYAISQGQKN